MKRRQLLILVWSIMPVSLLIGMDEPQKKSIDYKREFTALTKNKANLLCTLVAQEQAGNYSQKLAYAENILRTVIRFSGSSAPDIENLYANLDEKTLDFVKLITKKAYHRNTLIGKIDDCGGYAYATGCIHVCRQILKHNRYVANAYGVYHLHEDRIMMPLHYVLAKIAHGLLPAKPGKAFARLLLDHGANPNARDDFGNTPMHQITTPGFVRLLWRYGAQTTIKGYYGRTPLLHHIRLQNTPVVKCLLSDSCAPLNEPDKKGNTPLHMAAEQGNVKLVKLLLNKGSNWTLRNCDYRLPFEMTRDPIIRTLMRNHITSFVKNLLQTNNTRALQKIIHVIDLFSIIDISAMKKWINETYFDNAENTEAVCFFLKTMHQEVETELLNILESLEHMQLTEV